MRSPPCTRSTGKGAEEAIYHSVTFARCRRDCINLPALLCRWSFEITQGLRVVPVISEGPRTSRARAAVLVGRYAQSAMVSWAQRSLFWSWPHASTWLSRVKTAALSVSVSASWLLCRLMFVIRPGFSFRQVSWSVSFDASKRLAGCFGACNFLIEFKPCNFFLTSWWLRGIPKDISIPTPMSPFHSFDLSQVSIWWIIIIDTDLEKKTSSKTLLKLLLKFRQLSPIEGSRSGRLVAK